MRKSKGKGSAAVSARAFKTMKGSASPEDCSAASKSKRAIKRRVHAGKVNRPVQLSIFEYAAAIGVTLLPDES